MARANDFETLTAWLTETHLDRVPLNSEKRKLSAAIRSRVAQPLASALLDVLWWRRSSTLALWSAVIENLREHIPQPDTTDPDELTWRARYALKRLACDSRINSCLTTWSGSTGFHEILERNHRPAQIVQREIERTLRRIEGVEEALTEIRVAATASREPDRRCPRCEKPIRLRKHLGVQSGVVHDNYEYRMGQIVLETHSGRHSCFWGLQSLSWSLHDRVERLTSELSLAQSVSDCNIARAGLQATGTPKLIQCERASGRSEDCGKALEV